MVVFYHNRNPAEIARKKTPLCWDQQFSVKVSHTGRYKMQFSILLISPFFLEHWRLSAEHSILELIPKQIKDVQKYCDNVFFSDHIKWRFCIIRNGKISLIQLKHGRYLYKQRTNISLVISHLDHISNRHSHTPRPKGPYWKRYVSKFSMIGGSINPAGQNERSF